MVSPGVAEPGFVAGFPRCGNRQEFPDLRTGAGIECAHAAGWPVGADDEQIAVNEWRRVVLRGHYGRVRLAICRAQRNQAVSRGHIDPVGNVAVARPIGEPTAGRSAIGNVDTPEHATALGGERGDVIGPGNVHHSVDYQRRELRAAAEISGRYVAPESIGPHLF